MKKIILTIAAIVFVAAAAQAQSPRVEVSVANCGFSGIAAKSSRVAANTQSVHKLKRQALEKRVSSAITRAQAKVQQDNAKKRAQSATAGKATQQKKPAAKSAAAQTSPKKGSVGQWLKAIFLGGKLPGEASNAYHNRMAAQAYPAALPFK